ncbi:hypothetical protein BZA05DRAFT_393191 [Tricharina praecox]|uniref:uncharacterized protein n=1 Tax=Tricharina praecox TaxID=43433 RepID=UPI00221F6A08|nr:uncharacterized protein BZA05DRAFT_393191 [Tricharina praecox]KAI5854987.1 hypothetical protein BZA05DRAFT_393191 [Tricharina praecox]
MRVCEVLYMLCIIILRRTRSSSTDIQISPAVTIPHTSKQVMTPTIPTLRCVARCIPSPNLIIRTTEPVGK